MSTDREMCGLGVCAALAGHEGTCEEASGFEDWSVEDVPAGTDRENGEGDYEFWSCDGGATIVAVRWSDADELGCIPVETDILRMFLDQAGYVRVNAPEVV